MTPPRPLTQRGAEAVHSLSATRGKGGQAIPGTSEREAEGKTPDYALLQRALEPLSVDALERAFRVLPSLVDADAAFLARNACGIVAERLSWPDASALHHALGREGIQTEVIPQERLLNLPPAKKLKRADCLPQALLLYDPVGRPTEIGWSHVVVVAAGQVNLTEFTRFTKQRVLHRGAYGEEPTVVSEHHTKEERNSRLVLDLVLDVAPPRYRAQGDKFFYNYLGPRLQSDRTANFCSLVRDLIRYAPEAAQNRGAAGISEEPPRLLRYLGEHSFESETRWLLWHG